MHYKNKREARNGDTVIGKPEFAPAPMVGILQDINPQSNSCNAMIIRPGQITYSVTVGDFYHVEDALACIEEATARSRRSDPSETDKS